MTVLCDARVCNQFSSRPLPDPPPPRPLPNFRVAMSALLVLAILTLVTLGVSSRNVTILLVDLNVLLLSCLAENHLWQQVLAIRCWTSSSLASTTQQVKRLIHTLSPLNSSLISYVSSEDPDELLTPSHVLAWVLFLN